MSTSEQRVGSCLCGRIRFTVVGEPFYYAVCHCSNCKKFAGSAFMTNAFFRPDKVTITDGQELVRKYYDTNTISGNSLTRSFCSECGTSLFLSSPTKTDWIIPHAENRPDAKFSWVTALHTEEAAE
ncbi:Mss4-like protein [Mycena polygramma]|nr:Mss4-like protein [Mycena polygramma]